MELSVICLTLAESEEKKVKRKKEHNGILDHFSLDQQKKLLEYIFIAFVFCIVSGAFRMGFFVTLLFVVIVAFFLFCCGLLWGMLSKFLKYVYDRWLYNAVDQLRKFMRR